MKSRLPILAFAASSVLSVVLIGCNPPIDEKKGDTTAPTGTGEPGAATKPGSPSTSTSTSPAPAPAPTEGMAPAPTPTPAPSPAVEPPKTDDKPADTAPAPKDEPKKDEAPKA